eukprot:1185095-Prorocentrum_minimum.AAC.6
MLCIKVTCTWQTSSLVPTSASAPKDHVCAVPKLASAFGCVLLCSIPPSLTCGNRGERIAPRGPGHERHFGCGLLRNGTLNKPAHKMQLRHLRAGQSRMTTTGTNRTI